MSKEQRTDREAQPGTQAEDRTEGDVQGLPPYLHGRVLAVRPGDAEALRTLLSLHPDFSTQILAVASPRVGLSTVQQAVDMVSRNAVGRPPAPLTQEQIRPGGEFALEGDAPTAEPGWVAGARKYNAAHATLVDDFNELTAKLCLDWDKGEEGPLDPTKVATWQAKHGLVADGKVGPRTVAAARASKGEQVAQDDLLGDDARPPV